MRNGLPLAGTVFALVLATVVAAGAEERAIDFEATTLDGGVFDARELEGKIVLLDFWAVWCPPCIAAMPALSRLDRELGPRGFDVVGVAVHSGSPEDVAGFLEDKDVTYSVVVGDEVHVSLLKALSLLGLGRDRVVRVPADGEGRLRAERLPPLDASTIVCIQAGNVNTGAFDPAGDVCAAPGEQGRRRCGTR